MKAQITQITYSLGPQGQNLVSDLLDIKAVVENASDDVDLSTLQPVKLWTIEHLRRQTDHDLVFLSFSSPFPGT